MIIKKEKISYYRMKLKKKINWKKNNKAKHYSGE
jgi:hypothetical protein